LTLPLKDGHAIGSEIMGQNKTSTVVLPPMLSRQTKTYYLFVPVTKTFSNITRFGSGDGANAVGQYSLRAQHPQCFFQQGILYSY
tara:strand:- start:459 stop:713 length:255 start_codon:yes stop_codon:yes gene_type:complete